MDNNMIVFVDGEYLPLADARINVFDHGLLYGDGCFEGIRCYQGNIFRLGPHLERLWDCARYLNIEIPMTREEMEFATAETIRRNHLEDAYIRLVVTRGPGDLGLDPRKCRKATVFIIAASIALYPREMYEKGISIITSSQRRVPHDSLSPRVKSLNYLNNILAKMEANNAGANDAMLLDHAGHIVECTAANFFVVKNREITTPPTYQGALRGITRDAVIELAREAGFVLREERITQFEAYTADEVFVTGTGAEIMPITRIDARTIGIGKPGPVAAELTRRFRQIVTQQGVQIYQTVHP